MMMMKSLLLKKRFFVTAEYVGISNGSLWIRSLQSLKQTRVISELTAVFQTAVPKIFR